ncbi:MAG: zinc ribbon domain-containing protein [Acidimicrobiia bacterium]
MSTCPSCSPEVETDARFCPSCGSELGSRCPECGEALPEGARFCRHHDLAVLDDAGSFQILSFALKSSLKRARKIADGLGADRVLTQIEQVETG